MSNGAANCYLAVCCPPDSDAQRQALRSTYHKESGRSSVVRRAGADDALDWILQNFDLAPKGTLQPFKDAIAKLARENPAAPERTGT